MFDIKNLFIFEGLPDAKTEEICNRLTEVHAFARGEVIYDGARFKHALGVILEGKALAEKEDEAAMNVFTEGATFGAAAVFGAGESYVSKITAKTDCVVLFIQEYMLREIFAKEPVCAMNYIRFLSDRVRFLNGKISQFTAPDADEKLMRLLLSRADNDGVIRNVNMSFFATLSGMGRTSIYRALDNLEKAGRIKREGKEIIIPD